jgi:hypothetical protein
MTAVACVVMRAGDSRAGRDAVIGRLVRDDSIPVLHLNNRPPTRAIGAGAADCHA